MGFAAGAMGGLLGIGGGVLIVPALVFFLAFDQHRAHGTSLAIVIMLSLVGVVTYFSHHNVDLLFSAGIAVGGMVGAVIGGCIVQHIKSTALRRMFCMLLIATAVRMIYDAIAARHCVMPNPVHFSPHTALLAAGTGVLTGLVSSILGVGGGVVMVPMLTLLLGFGQTLAQGTSLAAMLPIAVTGMLKHRALGNVDGRAAAWMGSGAAVGASAGSHFANVMQGCHLKLIFGVFLAVMAVLMAAKR